MKNPWMKKNPFMSMWLSSANAMMGSARGRATAEGRRQATTLMANATQEAIRFWSGGIAAPRARRVKKSG